MTMNNGDAFLIIGHEDTADFAIARTRDEVRAGILKIVWGGSEKDEGRIAGELDAFMEAWDDTDECWSIEKSHWSFRFEIGGLEAWRFPASMLESSAPSAVAETTFTLAPSGKYTVTASNAADATLKRPEYYPPLMIQGANGKPLVTIKADGTLIYGEGHNPDEAAKIFWEAMSHHIPPPYRTPSSEAGRSTLADELEALAAKATEGPWAWDQRGEKVNEWGLGVAFTQDEKPIAGRFDDEDAVYVEYVCSHEAATCNYRDPELICALRNNLPEIIAALRASVVTTIGTTPEWVWWEKSEGIAVGPRAEGCKAIVFTVEEAQAICAAVNGRTRSSESEKPVAWRYKVSPTQQDWFYSWDQPSHVDKALTQPLYTRSATRGSTE